MIYSTWDQIGREWDEPMFESDDSRLAISCHLDNMDTCEHIEFDDYEQDEIVEDEETGDLWEDLGCSWRDFV